MTKQLPNELVVMILKLTAEIFRFTDRKTVVHLATTSKMIYDLVAPILYRTLIITASNMASFRNFDATEPVLARRICAHTRAMYLIGPGNRLNSFYKFPQVEQVQAIPVAISFLGRTRSPCTLRRIAVSLSTLDTLVDIGLPADARQLITHTTGDYPMGNSSDIMVLRAAWMKNLVDHFTALTHIGLVLVLWNSMITEFDLALLERDLKAALQATHLRQLALRVCGADDETRRYVGDIMGLLRTIGDARLRLWHDLRQISAWKDYKQCDLDDAKEGRSIWTEAVQLSSSA